MRSLLKRTRGLFNRHYDERGHSYLEGLGCKNHRQRYVEEALGEGRRRGLQPSRGFSRHASAALLKHFHKDVTKWVINDDHKAMVDYRQINLNGKWDELPGKWNEKPVFDIIFLRNVITYFSRGVAKPYCVSCLNTCTKTPT